MHLLCVLFVYSNRTITHVVPFQNNSDDLVCFGSINLKGEGEGEGEGKVVPVLFFNRSPRHEGVLGEWRYNSTQSLTLALDGSELSASRPGRFTPREGAPGTHSVGGWVGPRDGLDMVSKRKIPSPAGNRTPIIQPVASRYTD
jgi:hypothetical protein